MLTSEQQKIYNVKVPKGGYCYYTLYHGIYDPENNIDERPVYAQTGDLFEPEGSSVVYKATRKNGKTTWAIAEDAQRQSESGEGGSGGGSSLPSMTGKNGKVLGVTLDAQDHEQVEWVTPSGGGGAEKFIVTLTESNDTWSADKTIAEIVAADAAGKIVIGNVPLGGGNFVSLPFTKVADTAVMFSGVGIAESGVAVEVGGLVGGGVDSWFVFTQTIPTSTNAPLIVTMTAGATEGQLVGDKTYKEVYDAFMAGQNCILNIPDALGGIAVLAVDHETDYAINANGDISASGAANDYITITVGG